MAIPATILTPAESRDRSGPISPDITGPLRLTEGEGGAAWMIEEGTTNSIRNPTFSANTTYWTLFNTTAEIIHSGGADGGSYAAVTVTSPGATFFQSPEITSVLPGQTWAWSVHLRGAGSSIGRKVRVRLWWTIGNAPMSIFVDNDIALTGEWVRYTAAGTAPESTANARADVRLNGTGKDLQVGETVHVDMGQLEQKPVPTSYADGSLGSGYAWTNNPHTSVSTRDDGTLSAPHASPLGSILIRTRESGIVTTEHVQLTDGAGTFGTAGTITHDGTTLVIGTTREVEMLGVVTYTEALSPGERDRVSAMDVWAWAGIVDVVPYILRTMPPEPFVIARTTPDDPYVISRTNGENPYG